MSGTGPRVFRITTEGAITWSRHFDSEKEAEAYVDAHPLERLMVVGCEDPAVSCFALPAVEGLRRVFSSDPLPISPERTVRAVKVFEVVR